MVRAPSSPWRGGYWYTARAEEDDQHFKKWVFDNIDRSTVDNFSLAALRKVTYSTFGTRTKPGLLENFSTLESRVGVFSKRLEMLERILDGFSIEDVEKAVEKCNDIEYLAEKVASLEKIVTGRSKRLDALENDGEKLKKSALLLGEKLDDHEKSMNKLTQQQAGSSHEVTDHDYGQLLSKVVRLEVVVNNNAMFTTDRLAAAARSTEALFDHVHVEYPNQSERIKDLERGLEKLRPDYQLGERFEDTDARFEALESSMAKAEQHLKERIELLASSIPEIPKIVEAIGSAVKPDIIDIAGRTKKLEEDAEDFLRQHSSTFAEVEGYCSQMGSLLERVQVLEDAESDRKADAEDTLHPELPTVPPDIRGLFDFLRESSRIPPSEWVYSRVEEEAHQRFRFLVKLNRLSRGRFTDERISSWSLGWLKTIGDYTAESFYQQILIDMKHM